MKNVELYTKLSPVDEIFTMLLGFVTGGFGHNINIYTSPYGCGDTVTFALSSGNRSFTLDEFIEAVGLIEKEGFTVDREDDLIVSVRL